MIRYRAYFQQGSGLYGPKLDELMDDDEFLLVSFWKIFFKVIYSDGGGLVDGARTYLSHVGYVSNNGNAVVPFESTINHKANLGSVWSPQYAKMVDGTFEVVIYEWDGAAFGEPIYEDLEEPEGPGIPKKPADGPPREGRSRTVFQASVVGETLDL